VHRQEPVGWRDEHSEFSQIATAALHATTLQKLDGKRRRVMQQAVATWGKSEWIEVPGHLVDRALRQCLEVKFLSAGPHVGS
jgi:hypothetical protein